MATVNEEIVIGVSVDTKNAEGSLGSLEDRLEELTEKRKSIPIGTEGFDKLSREIQGIESQIKNVELEFEALDFEQQLTAGTDAVIGLTGGFMAAQGVMSMVGTESESLEMAFTRMSQALTITMGLRDLANGIIAIRKFNIATKLATAGQWALNVAMNANPITIVIGALALLVAQLLIYAAATKDVSKEERIATITKEQLTKASQKAAESIVDEQVKLNSLLKVARDKNASDKARAEAVKQLNELSPEYLGALTTENVLTEEGTKLVDQYNEALKRKAMAQALEEELVELYKQRIAAQKDARAGYYEEAGIHGAFLTGFKTIFGDAEEAVSEAQETAIKGQKKLVAGIDEQIEVVSQLLSKQQDQTLQLDANSRAYEEQAKATKKSEIAQKSLADVMKKALSESLKAQEQDRADFYQALEELETNHFNSFKTDQEKEEQAVQDKFFNMIELAKRYGEDTAMLEEARQRQLQLIRKKYATDELIEKGETELEIQKLLEQARIQNIADENERTKAERQKKFDDETLALLEQGMLTAELEKEMKMKLDSDLAELDKKAKEEQKQRNIDTINAGFQAAQNSINALSQLNEASVKRQVQGLEEGDKRRVAIEKQAFERGKKIQIAQAIISGLQGVVNIWSAKSTIPQPYDNIFRVINTFALAAITAAQISKIKSTPFAGGGGGSISGGGSGASAGAGAVPINNISNTASLVDQQQQELTAQVVVLESDITTTQENVTAVSELSSF